MRAWKEDELEVVFFLAWWIAFWISMTSWREDELARMRRAERLYRRHLRRMEGGME